MKEEVETEMVKGSLHCKWLIIFGSVGDCPWLKKPFLQC